MRNFVTWLFNEGAPDVRYGLIVIACCLAPLVIGMALCG